MLEIALQTVEGATPKVNYNFGAELQPRIGESLVWEGSQYVVVDVVREYLNLHSPAFIELVSVFIDNKTNDHD